MIAPLISIIVPIYQVELYLEKCIDSIINQTYKNLEIILIDDGSPDRCGAICDEYAGKDSRIRVIHQKNGGLSAARNAGLDIAKGDYIQFVDSDDWIEPEACETVLTIAEEQHADIVCFGFCWLLPTGETTLVSVNSSSEIEEAAVIKQLICKKSVIRNFAWNKLFVRKLFDGVRFPVGRTYEDICVTYQLVHKADKIYATKAILYHYVTRENSISSKRFNAKTIKDLIAAYKQPIEFLQSEYPEYADMQIAHALREMLNGWALLENDPDYPRIMGDLKEFKRKHHSKMHTLTKYNKTIWLYYYCRPLAYLMIKYRYGKK